MHIFIFNNFSNSKIRGSAYMREMLKTYFVTARLEGRLICEVGLYAGIYGSYITNFKEVKLK